MQTAKEIIKKWDEKFVSDKPDFNGRSYNDVYYGYMEMAAKEYAIEVLRELELDAEGDDRLRITYKIEELTKQLNP